MQRICLFLFSMACLAVSAQTTPSSGGKLGPQWHLLEGAWIGESPDNARSGSCAFRFDLGGHVIVRTNHAEIPPGGNLAPGVHDDLMIIYPGSSGAQARASYWDNEGHVIEYSASWSADGNTLTFLSKPGSGPQFRLTYKKEDAEHLTVNFEIAAPGQAGAFKTYTSGRIKRQK